MTSGELLPCALCFLLMCTVYFSKLVQPQRSRGKVLFLDVLRKFVTTQYTQVRVKGPVRSGPVIGPVLPFVPLNQSRPHGQKEHARERASASAFYAREAKVARLKQTAAQLRECRFGHGFGWSDLTAP